MSERKLFHFETAHGIGGDHIELIGTDTSLNVTAESPWDGDTETGFGRDVTVSLSKEDAVSLRDAITNWLEAVL